MWLLVRDSPTGLDREGFSALATHRGSLLAHAVDVLSFVGRPLAAITALVVIVLLWRRRRWREGAVIVGGSLLTLVAAHVAKDIQQRPRPYGDLLEVGGYSFPSTDAALSVVVVVLAIVAGRLTHDRVRRGQLLALGVVLTVITGVLLVSVRVHYMTDVLAGWGLGAAAFAAAALATSAFAGIIRAGGR